jgi:hypothetical protein
MPDILVVVGSVTTEQYREARLRILRRDRKPEVVRMEREDVVLADDFMLEDLIAERETLPSAFDGINPDSVVGYVMPDELWDSRNEMGRLGCALQNREELFMRLEDRWLIRPDGTLFYL